MAVDKQSSEIGANGMTFDKYGIYRIPTFIVIDKEGTLMGKWDHSIEEEVEELLSK